MKRAAAVQKVRRQLHRRDHAPARKWNQPDQSLPRQKPAGSNPSSRPARLARKIAELREWNEKLTRIQERRS